MDTNRKQIRTHPLEGNLLRLNDHREIAIYLRDGAAWVAEFKDGKGELHFASAWFGTDRGRTVAYAQRRGEVEYISPIPAEVIEQIECLHQHEAKSSDALMTMVPLAVSRLANWLRSILARATKMQYTRAAPRSHHSPI